MEEIVHIIPLGIEYDRATVPFTGKNAFKTNRVYIFTLSQSSKAPFMMVEDHFKKAERVKSYFKEENIEATIVETNLIDLLDVMKKISNIVRKEKTAGNHVYINLSSAGRLTSIAVALVGMFHDVKTYYVKADKYSETKQEREIHGITICEKRDVAFLENFKLVHPNDVGLKVLVEIYKKEKMKSEDILEFLSRSKEEGFENYLITKKRSEKRVFLMRLNRRIMDKLESSGYVIKNRIGRKNEYELTESGKYIANLCGLIKD